MTRSLFESMERWSLSIFYWTEHKKWTRSLKLESSSFPWINWWNVRTTVFHLEFIEKPATWTTCTLSYHHIHTKGKGNCVINRENVETGDESKQEVKTKETFLKTKYPTKQRNEKYLKKNRKRHTETHGYYAMHRKHVF